MDDLEKAILLVYEPGAADLSLRAQAMAFCDRAKADPSALLRLCLDRLNRSPLVPVHFWCLQALHDAILLRYPSIPPPTSPSSAPPSSPSPPTVPSPPPPLLSSGTSSPRPSPPSSASSTPPRGPTPSSALSPASPPPTPPPSTCSPVSSSPSMMTSSATTIPGPLRSPPMLPVSKTPCACSASPGSPVIGSMRRHSTGPPTLPSPPQPLTPCGAMSLGSISLSLPTKHSSPFFSILFLLPARPSN
ncbi:unnamed protein product [Musa textilis]